MGLEIEMGCGQVPSVIVPIMHQNKPDSCLVIPNHIRHAASAPSQLLVAEHFGTAVVQFH